jgi:hypothetical protein
MIEIDVVAVDVLELAGFGEIELSRGDTLFEIPPNVTLL